MTVPDAPRPRSECRKTPEHERPGIETEPGTSEVAQINAFISDGSGTHLRGEYDHERGGLTLKPQG